MKNSIFVIVFLMLVRPVIPVADYIINYDYITKVLCVNKAKPMMHCNGKCHLMKELAKTAEQDKPLSQKKSNVAEAEVLFLEPLSSFTFQLFFTQLNTRNTSLYSNLYVHINSDSIFHPPLVIS
ncbi:hypothetical protein Q765_15615 [Flavobacterium rivuli WB 3.3-2 = DSM 21788]|uniref:Uncharacterized protein n=1 Tax=Flavobacterium rivuli WB 3.3-2 = DSM 21788 TaxID=1121895 RepID=A0A0A2M219_9FLAO|nr:hypothetical protein [Flavobacterium rivuli]KGO85636.1 hypothetical protein Q765_15615 [Flavobacterium rivuli WB 3.3-2 = DSM 21788]